MYRIAGFAVTIAAAGVLAISPALAQQSQTGTTGQGSQQGGMSGQQQTGTRGQARQARLTSSERQEIKNAVTASMAQVEYSRLAQQKAQSEDVKNFANQIVDRRTQMVNELRDFASRHQIDLPTQISGKERKEVDRLSNLSGQDFDRAYLQAIDKEQNQRITAWQNISQRTTNDDLRQFANLVLPRLQEQQTMVRQHMASLGITPSAPLTDEEQRQQRQHQQDQSGQSGQGKNKTY